MDGAPQRSAIDAVGSASAAGTGEKSGSDRYQVRVRDDEPLAAGRLEVDLHAGLGSLSFVHQHDTRAELRVLDPLPEAQSVRSVVNRLRAGATHG